MYYKTISREEILNIYDFAMKKRKEGFGQRNISKMIKEKFGKEISEGAISNWIFYKRIPFGNEKTQFKSLSKPKKEALYELYIKRKQSAQKMAKLYKVSTIVVINWLKYYSIKPRTHLESMNTELIKKELRAKKLRKPTKSFSNLSSAKAYILGVLCGDGSISKKSIRFEIRNDEEFIKKFAECLKQVYGLEYKYNYYQKRNSLVLYVSSEIICSDLLRYGKFKTLEWNIPVEILKTKDEKIISNFLRGVFDSEGSANRYCISMSSVNKTGVEGINFLLNKLDIENKIMIARKKYYILYITKRERLKRFRDKVGFTIKRKMEPLNLLK